MVLEWNILNSNEEKVYFLLDTLLDSLHIEYLCKDIVYSVLNFMFDASFLESGLSKWFAQVL